MEWLPLVERTRPESEEPEPPRGHPMPYTSPEMGAGCVKPLVNEYYSEGCYLWVVLEQTDADLEVEDAAFDQATDPPPWVEYMLSDVGLEDIVGCGRGSFRGWGGVLEWSMENGIAPGQPFLIFCSRPWTTKTWTDYGWEYDVDFEAWIVRRLPTEMGVRQYERVVSEVFSDRQKILDAERLRR